MLFRSLGGGSGDKRNDLHEGASASGLGIDEGELEEIATKTRGGGSKLGGREDL